MKIIRSEPKRLRFSGSGIIPVMLLITSAPFSSTVLDAQDAKALRTVEAAKPAQRKTIIRQTSQATCGPASLATLLTFYFNDPVTEEEMVKLTGTDNKTMAKLLDLRNASRARGYKADGFRMQLPQLLREVEKSGVPVLVHFKEPTQHFLLVVGSAGDFILVSDPSRGEVSIHQTDFLRRWDNFALVVKTTRPVNSALVEKRKRSAETRIQTLRQASSLMSRTRF
jgi:uncharacterized protein